MFRTVFVSPANLVNEYSFGHLPKKLFSLGFTIVNITHYNEKMMYCDNTVMFLIQYEAKKAFLAKVRLT